MISPSPLVRGAFVILIIDPPRNPRDQRSRQYSSLETPAGSFCDGQVKMKRDMVKPTPPTSLPRRCVPCHPLGISDMRS